MQNALRLDRDFRKLPMDYFSSRVVMKMLLETDMLLEKVDDDHDIDAGDDHSDTTAVADAARGNVRCRHNGQRLIDLLPSPKARRSHQHTHFRRILHAARTVGCAHDELDVGGWALVCPPLNERACHSRCARA
eukprot:4466863-Pleurochrysis_carterae.AAC.9